MKECGNCKNLDDCTPCEKQLFVGTLICEDYIDIDCDCLEEESEAKWEEVSYNRYTETLWDYGEMSEWDLYIIKKY